jgi:serine O-acetyltransferase
MFRSAMSRVPKERVLADAIDAIVESYEEHGSINHLAGSNLPSRKEVDELLSDLVSIVFPGFFVREQIDPLTTRYFVGERCARVLRGLERLSLQAMDLGDETGSKCVDDELARRAHEVAIDLIRVIPRIRTVLVADVQAALAGDPAARSAAEIIMAYPGVEAIVVHRIAHELHRLVVPLIPRMMSELVHARTGIDIHPGATIGGSFFIDHGTGVVIGETTVIGERVKLYQGVTLGALSVRAGARSQAKRHPTLEDDVTIYAGATILGGDTVVGRGSVVGGNVWITQSVPPSTTVMLDKPNHITFRNRNALEVTPARDPDPV